jgi:cyclomaltodextrinase
VTRLALVLPALAALAAAPALAQAPPGGVPAWTRRAVWYQVFPERFRNGDPANDPTPESMEGAWPQVGTARLREAGWAPTPWTHDWYRQEDWARRLGTDFYTAVQLRRYGGDLQGLRDALPYLDSLGVTALYVNPLNDAPSLHKYDARHYHHVDVHLGPDPEGDRRIMAAEDPADPATWRWTAADSLFLRVVQEVHRRGMRLVMDYSWNHTGTQFWAFQDVLRRGADSPYAGWYYLQAFDDPATPDTNEFAYAGWAGVRELPELQEVDRTGNPHDGVPYDGNLVEPVRDHIFAVTRRWLDPDGDGDPSDGVDGVRLDVAEMVPLGFWRAYRAFVKGVNPEAALLGEIWWQRWPTLLMDPAPYLGVFDGVMHYRWYPPARSLVTGVAPASTDGALQMTPSRFAAHLDSLWRSFPPGTLPASMSTAGTHDAPRLATELLNAEVRYKTDATPRARPDYRTGRPDAAARRAQRLLLLLQFTLPGAPHLFYGDEAGMWGADDPDNRKPMVWAGLPHEPEAFSSDGTPRPPDSVGVDDDLWAFYRALIALRRQHAALLAEGAVVWETTDDHDRYGLLVYRRTLGDSSVTVAFNFSETPKRVGVPSEMRPALVAGEPPERDGGIYTLPARSGAVFEVPPGGLREAD